jgi:hypothetical protein
LSLIAGGLMGGCVPRERPEGDQGQGPPKTPRATAVASREEIPEDPGALTVRTDAQPPAPVKRTQPLPPTSASASAAAAPSARPELKSGHLSPATTPSAAAVLSDDPPLTTAFTEDFDRDVLGQDWNATAAQWRIDSGKLCVKNARNHPLWLKRRLPRNARIEFTATSYADEGDIKVEMWGDGKSSAASTSYNDATGYLAIFGGWQNKFHVLARLDEHAANRPEIKLVPDSDDPRAIPVENGTEYAFRIERSDGKTMRWLVDDIELFAFQDPAPLSGPGHDHFGFNDWQVRVCFDDLKIVPLP